MRARDSSRVLVSAASDSGLSSLDGNGGLHADALGRLTDEELEGLDPAERKLAKQRAKNRRTAAASRERKKAYVQKLEHQNADLINEMKALTVLLAAKEEQLRDMKAARGLPVKECNAASRRKIQQNPELKNQLMLLAMYAKGMEACPERDSLEQFVQHFTT